MFFQPPDKEQQPTIKVPNNPHRKRKKKSSKKNKRGVKKEHIKRKNNRFSITMSSWAESFTTAATWQLKHQVAYWKSKATTLEYENRILHDIIKKIYANNSNDDDIPIKEPSIKSDSESEVENYFQNEVEEENDDFEVSEEFIQFLKDNAKFKEDAKRERELLKTKITEEQQPMDMLNDNDREESTECMEGKLKELYGKDWQRIAALEMSMKCNFMNECDREKPMYWPNIPFNFNYS